MAKSVAFPAFVGAGSVPAPTPGRLRWRWAVLTAGCYLFAFAGTASPSVADESVIALINKKPAQASRASARKAGFARAAARSNTTKSTASEARVVLPDPSLLASEPAFDCVFKGPVSSPITVEETRMKLDYEAQCYRQSEAIVRARLEALQQAVGRMINRTAQRDTAPASR